MFNKVGFISMLMLAFTAFTVFAAENYSTWPKSTTIAINTGSSEGGAKLQNPVSGFPLLVRLTPENFIDLKTPGTRASIRFSKINDVHFPYQVEHWDSTSAISTGAEVWVWVDTLFANVTAQTFKMFWGKIGVADNSNGSAVFDSSHGFQAVWHMEGDSSNVADASGSGLTGANNGTVAGTGNIGAGRIFNGASNWISAPNTPLLDFTNNFTISAWFNSGNWSNSPRIIQRGSNSERFAIRDSSLFMTWATQGPVETSNPAFPEPATGTWHLVHGTFSDSIARVYLDGVLQMSLPSAGPSYGAAYTTIGARAINATSTAANFFNGTLDEVRIHKVLRDSNWIRLEYETQKSGANAVAVGTPPTLAYAFNPATYSTHSGPDTLAAIATGSLPISFSILSGNLPPGLTLNGTTGKITGTPVAQGVYSAIVQAINPIGSDTETVNITVLQTPVGLEYTANTPIYLIGTPIIADTATLISGVAGKFKVTSGALPAGLTMDSVTGKISGTPTLAGTFTLTITASNIGGGFATKQLTIQVLHAPAGLAYSPNPVLYSTQVGPDTMNATLLQGDVPLIYSILSGLLPTGMSLDSATGKITGTPTSAGNYSLLIRALNPVGMDTETVIITVLQSPVGLTYTANTPTYGRNVTPVLDSARLASGTASKFKVTSGGLPSGLVIDTLNGMISGIPTTAGIFTPTITASNAGGGMVTRQLTLTILNPPASLSYSENPAAYGVSVNIANNTPAVTGTNSISHYSVNPALPAGLAIDSINGILSGTPATAQAATNYAITASNVAGSATANLSIAILAAPTGLTYFAPTATYGVGIPIANNNPNITGTAAHYTSSPGLPAGLILDSATGVISGTPVTAHATAQYTITASNIAGFTTTNIHITVLAAPSNFSYVLGSPVYGVNLPVLNDTPIVIGTVTHYSISPALPAGLTLDSNTGILSGTPASAQLASNYTVTAANLAGSTSTDLSITILTAPTNLIYSTNPAIYGEHIAIANNTPSFTGVITHYSISPALPAGLNLDTMTGTITGTPGTTTSTANFLVTGSNVAGQDTETVRITILAAPANLSYPALSAVYGVGVTIANDSPTVTGTVTHYSVNPPLPSGLGFDSITGVISGTPTTASVAGNYIVTATNIAGSTTRTLNRTVLAAPLNLFYSANPVVYGVGIAIANNSPSVTGTVTHYSVSPPLPAGLNLDSNSGVISGMPGAAVPNTAYLVTGSNLAGADSKTIHLTVLAAPTGLVYTTPAVYGVGVAINNNIPTFTGTITHYSISPNLSAGLTLDSITGVVSGTPLEAKAATQYSVLASNVAGFATTLLNITVLAAPSHLSYPETSVVYGVNIPITTSANNAPVVTGTVTRYAISPAPPAGIVFDSLTGLLSGTPLAAQAASTYTISASNLAGAANVQIHITILFAPTNLSYSTPVIYGVNVPAVINSPVITGTATLYTASPMLPSGLVLDSASGIISGTPLAASSASQYVITARNIAGSTTGNVNITVLAAPSGLHYNTPVVYGVNVAATPDTPAISGTVAHYSISPALADGLTLDSNTGILSGTAVAALAATNYTITAANIAGSTTAQINLRVVIPPGNLSYVDDHTTYVLGVASTPNTASVTGYVSRFTTTPALPSGLRLDSTTGTLSGTPTGSQSFATSYVITAANIAGQVQTTLVISVVGPPSSLSYADDAPTYGINRIIAPSNTPAVHGIVTLYSITPALPAGIVLDQTTGYILGTPTVLSTARSYTIVAQNPGGTATTSITLGVVNPP